MSEGSDTTDAERTIDELDRALVNRLRADGRASNRSLAAELGVNEATVANRLRRLEQARIMRVVALTDMAAFGYEFLAFAKLRVRDRSVMEVAADVAQLAESISVVVSTGRYDVIAALLARDRRHLAELIGTSLRQIPGVAAIDTELALEVLRYESMWGALEASEWPLEPWENSEVVDDLDLAIIRALQRDGRTSNRRIAADLGVSEGTIRSRIRRLEDEGVIRIQAVSDPVAFGFESHAFVGVQVAGGMIEEVARGLLEIDSLLVIARTLGEYDLLALVATPDRRTLAETVLGRVRSVPAVDRTETIETWATVKHAYLWAHLV